MLNDTDAATVLQDDARAAVLHHLAAQFGPDGLTGEQGLARALKACQTAGDAERSATLAACLDLVPIADARLLFWAIAPNVPREDAVRLERQLCAREDSCQGVDA